MRVPAAIAWAAAAVLVLLAAGCMTPAPNIQPGPNVAGTSNGAVCPAYVTLSDSYSPASIWFSSYVPPSAATPFSVVNTPTNTTPTIYLSSYNQFAYPQLVMVYATSPSENQSATVSATYCIAPPQQSLLGLSPNNATSVSLLATDNNGDCAATVSLYDATGLTKIYYTIGQQPPTPTSTSNVYLSGGVPLSLQASQSTTISAIAYTQAANPTPISSPVSSVTYNCPPLPPPSPSLISAQVIFDNAGSGKDPSENYWVYLYTAGSDTSNESNAVASFPEASYPSVNGSKVVSYSQGQSVNDSLVNLSSPAPLLSAFQSIAYSNVLQIAVHGNFSNLFHTRSDWWTDVQLKLTFSNNTTYVIDWYRQNTAGPLGVDLCSSNSYPAGNGPYLFNFSWDPSANQFVAGVPPYCTI